MIKNILLVFILFFFFIVFHASAVKPAWFSPKVLQSIFLDITVVDDNYLIAVGERGHILLSLDGKSWQQVTSPVDSTLTDVFFVDNLNGWIVGHDAVILHTDDGGKTWHIQQFLPELEKPLFNIIFKDQDNGIAVGAYGLMYRTINGGEHWQLEFHEEFLNKDDKAYLSELKNEDQAVYIDERSAILPHFNHIEKNGRTLYLVGEMGLVAKSNDFGEMWQVIPPFYHGSFFDLLRTEHGDLLVSGLRGNLFFSDNNADTWIPIKIDSNLLLNAIVQGSNNTIYLLANGGVLYKSNSGGKTVERVKQTFRGSLIDAVWFKERLIVASDQGLYSIFPDIKVNNYQLAESVLLPQIKIAETH